MNREAIADELGAIVADFNGNFAKWMNDTGCRATFGWLYGPEKQIKQLEVQEINLMVYRKPPPDGQTLEKLLAGKK